MKPLLVPLLVLVSIIAGAYLSQEAYIAYRVLRSGRPGEQKNRVADARRAGIAFDERTPAEVLRALRAERPVVGYLGMREMMGLWRETDELFPLSSLSNVEALYCNESGSYLTFHSDGWGFNNPEPVDVERADVVLIGDSFAHGVCVSPEHNIAGALRPRLGRVLNLGYVGAGPLAELGIFEEFARPLHPRNVIWEFFEANDLEDLAAEGDFQPLARYLQPGYRQGLAARGDAHDRVVREYLDRMENHPWRERFFQFHPPLLASLGFAALRRARPRDLGEQVPRLRQIIERVRDELATEGGRLTFVYVPAWQRYGGYPLYGSHRDEVLAAVRSLGVRLVDINSAMDKDPDPIRLYPLRGFGHFNETGYAFVADQIARDW